MFHAWTNRPGREVIEFGEVHEKAEQSADASYDKMQAPPCVGCGDPVSDRDFYRHMYERHGKNEMVQPFGRPDAREALFLAHSPAELQRKVAIWRDKHPGVALALAADGTRYGGLLVFARYRVFDYRGKAAR